MIDTFQLMKEISEAAGVAGFEDEIRNLIKNKIKDQADDIFTDRLGNLFAVKNGTKNNPTILFSAHMDNIGFMINHITDKGFLRIVPVGGMSTRILPATRVKIFSSKTEKIYNGVIGEKAIHLLDAEERKKLSKFHDLFVDMGARNKDDAKELVNEGDYVVFDEICKRLGSSSSLITSKGLDDRAGCVVLIKLLQALKEETFDGKVVILFSTQEEIGVRGATVGAYRINPDIGFAVEVTHAIDFPGSNKDKEGDVVIGNGGVIAVGPNIHPKISKLAIKTAQEKKIDYQVEVEPRPTGTDARIIQMTREGVAAGLISVPLRYMHTPSEVLDLEDIEKTVRLLVEIIKNIKSNINLNL
ncbi:MAG: M42 family metallopeptidase [Candidatus Helarchaeota archaeon]